jgi:hypothetical protein
LTAASAAGKWGLAARVLVGEPATTSPEPDPRSMQPESTTMSAPKGDKFNERLENSASAKKALLDKFRAQPKPDDPAVIERDAARAAAAAAREARIAERKAARAAEAARLEAEAARAAAEQAAREAAQKAQEEASRIAKEAEQKAARDARYKARKARR